MKFDATHQVKWNKFTHARRHFTLRSNISHAKRISQIPQGIYFVEKDLCFVSKHRSFSGGEGGIWTLDTLLGYTRFPIVRARPATRLLHFYRNCGQPVYNTLFVTVCQDLFSICLRIYLSKIRLTLWRKIVIILSHYATVAQSVEQLIRNQQVAGSSPASSSKRRTSKEVRLFMQ